MLLMLLSACASHGQTTPKQSLSQKSFEAEDAYILYALRAEEIGDSKSAVKLFNTLYEKSSKKEYLYKMLTNQIASREYQAVIQKVDKVTLGSLDDYKLTRLKIIALYQLHKYEKAQKIAAALVTKSQVTNDYLLLSDIYLKQSKDTLALKSLENAYGKEYDEKILDKLSVLLFVNLNRPKEAIAKLETHSRIRGCSEIICKRLIGFYSKTQNLDGILATYLRMYEKDKNEAVAKKIIQIYGYKKEYQSMIAFLEKYDIDAETLLELYTVTKEYKKAFHLADKLYKNSGDISYLGQSAIFEYESANKQNNRKVLQSVVKKLEAVVKKENSPLYENYLGYVLIDHEIDIKKGMQHIQNVLLVKPDSGYYLDSLAWGYYKLHQCTKAKKIMEKVVKLEGGDDPEVIKHVKIINKCVNSKKVKK